MSNLTCPHCHNSVPMGASVCRGCHAELKYGPSRTIVSGLIVLAIVVGTIVSSILPHSMSIAGWIVGIGTLGFLYTRVNRIYRDRVVFKRVYRTR